MTRWIADHAAHRLCILYNTENRGMIEEFIQIIGGLCTLSCDKMEKDKNVVIGLAFLSCALVFGAGFIVWILIESGRDLRFSGDDKKPHIPTEWVVFIIIFTLLIFLFLFTAYRKCCKIFKSDTDSSSVPAVDPWLLLLTKDRDVGWDMKVFSSFLSPCR